MMKNPRWSLLPLSVGLASLAAAACIDTGSLMRPSGAGGTSGTFAIAGSGGAAGLPGGGGASGGMGLAGSGSDAGATSGSVSRCGTDGLLAYYPFDHDTSDYSGGGQDVVAAGVTATTGVFDGAYSFDGFSSQMHVTGGIDVLLGARTLCAWIKPESVTGPGQPVFAAGDVQQGDLFAL